MSGAEGDETRLSLLQGLATPEIREESWRLFLARYQPLIRRWCRRWSLQDASIDDVSADVLAKLHAGVGAYRLDKGRFRGWLQTVVANTVRDHLRRDRRRPADRAAGGDAAHEELARVEDSAAELAETLDHTLDDDVRRAVAAVRARVEPKSWEAFERRVQHGESAKDVAAALGMSAAAVHQAVYRVGQHLQREYLNLLGGAAAGG